MRESWAWVSLACVLGCQAKSGGQAQPSATAAAAPTAPAAAAAAAKLDARGCLAQLDYLVPPQRFGDADSVRAIVVDQDRAYFHDRRHVFSVPLAGGKVAAHSQAPGLSLTGTTVLWASGERLLTQPAGEPSFLAAPKTGGEWSNILVTSGPIGAREGAPRLLHGPGDELPPRASPANFDGESFYFAEVSQGRGPPTSALVSLPLRGGERRTVFETPGEISEVVRAGDRIAFMLAAGNERWLMAIPVGGGQASRLMRISNIITSSVLGADGNRIYVSGYADEDPTKPGIYRVSAAGGAPEQLDRRVLSGSVYVSGQQLVFIGSGDLQPGKIESGQLVLVGQRDGQRLTRPVCIKDGYTLHASAVTGKTALLSLFKTDTRLASIARLSLP